MLEHQSLEQDANTERKNHTQWFPRCHATMCPFLVPTEDPCKGQNCGSGGCFIIPPSAEGWRMLCLTATGLKEELV